VERHRCSAARIRGEVGPARPFAPEPGRDPLQWRAAGQQPANPSRSRQSQADAAPSVCAQETIGRDVCPTYLSPYDNRLHQQHWPDKLHGHSESSVTAIHVKYWRASHLLVPRQCLRRPNSSTALLALVQRGTSCNRASHTPLRRRRPDRRSVQTHIRRSDPHVAGGGTLFSCESGSSNWCGA